VAFDQKVASTTDFVDDRLQPRLLHLDRSAARTAHDVMVMLLGRARDVRVLARRQIDPLERLDLRQQVKRPEDRCATYPEAADARQAEQIRGREVATLLGDQADQRLARARHASPAVG
jgi:hypothetical protein